MGRFTSCHGIIYFLFWKKQYLCCPLVYQIAPVAELVDALDSKSCSFGSAGSLPARGTKKQSEKQSESEVGISAFFFIFILFPFLKREGCCLFCFFFHSLSFFKARGMLFILLFSSFSFPFQSGSYVLYSAFFLRSHFHSLSLFKARAMLFTLLFSSFSFSFLF